MEWTRRQGRIIAAAVLATVAVLALARLSAFGIWDPWELGVADLARQVATGEASGLDRPPLVVHLVGWGFALFGIHEWSGRLPMALSGLLAVGLGYALVARFAGRRAGVWTAIAAGTTPLFLFNSRQMLGVAPAFAASAAVFLCAMSAVFAPTRLGAGAAVRRRATAAWLVGLVVASALATLASGALTGLAPPLLAAAVAVAVRGELRRSSADRLRTGVAWAVLSVGLLSAIGAARAVWADYATFGFWTGGVPRGGDPPTWEVAVEHVFHSFAPWSALLPLALARMLAGAPRPDAIAPTGDRRLAPTREEPRVDHPEEDALRLGVVAWVAFGFLAQTLFSARFGPATFLPLIGAAAAVGVMIHDVERSRRGWWGSAVVVFLFVGLLVRDFRAYPGGPIEGLAIDGIEVPEAFNPRVAWAIVLGAFGLLIALGLAADPSAERPAWRRDVDRVRDTRAFEKLLAVLRFGVPVDLILTQWRRGVGFKIWSVLFAAVLVALLGFGLSCWVAPEALTSMGTTSLVVDIGRALAVVPPALVLAVAGVRVGLWLFARLGENRLVPALVAAVAVGGYAAIGFQPELSSHFSPREVYDTYNELAADDEPLGEFRVGGRAAAYYASADDIRELGSQPELVRFLQSEERVWAAFRADDLAAVDREYRRAAGRHLFIADARSARMLLATNQPIEGRENQNYLADAVLDEPPVVQHPTQINFDNRIELLGYDLELPRGSYVGPGQTFAITWYFRVIAPVPGGYQPFVHIDGPGQRINGDHEPVGGRYPVRLWEAGDIIADRHEVQVPGNYQRGNLTIYMGFYSGEQRLEVVSGPEDDVNRARAGTLPVR